MAQRDKSPGPADRQEGSYSSLPAVSRETLSSRSDRARTTPSPATSGRCGFCGSNDTFSVSPQTFHEWALERWADAALLRCHDCGRRQAIAGLSSLSPVEWSFGRAALKLAAWTLVVAGALALLAFVLRKNEEPPPQQRFRIPKEKPSPSAPSPSPPSGPFSLRSTPASAA